MTGSTTESSFPNISLLLVDDDDAFREATGKVLARRGFEITEAATGEKALEVIRASPPDVVLLDLRMEGMDGIETLRNIREISLSLPVIILTGDGRYEDAVTGLELGLTDFIHKPIGVAQLAARIRKHLSEGSSHPLFEKKIADLMVPLAVYRRVSVEDDISTLVETLRDSLTCSLTGALTEQGHRSVLAYDHEGNFVGLVHVRDVLAAIMPEFLHVSPYSSYFTGMFLARTKMLTKRKVIELVDDAPPVDIDVPLMEALHLMLQRNTINLPIARDTEIVGVLRDKDLLVEVASLICQD